MSPNEDFGSANLRADGGQQTGPSTDDIDREVLTDLFAVSFQHPANWGEWRKTLVVFATVAGYDKSTVLNAHTNAQHQTDTVAPDEVSEGLEAAEELVENLRERDEEWSVDTETDQGGEGHR